MAGSANIGIAITGIPGRFGIVGMEKLGSPGIGIAGNVNIGIAIIGRPGKFGRLGMVNDGNAGNGIAGRANAGIGIGGKAQYVTAHSMPRYLVAVGALHSSSSAIGVAGNNWRPASEVVTLALAFVPMCATMT